jgi:hypothetical protein
MAGDPRRQIDTLEIPTVSQRMIGQERAFLAD